MSVAETLAHVQQVRSRLRNPANAVPDLGIDLKRPRKVLITEHQEATIVPVMTREPRRSEPTIESLELAIREMRTKLRAMVKNVDGAPKVLVEEIQHIVASKYGLSRTDLVSQRRTAALVRARHIAIYLSKELTTNSYPRLGKLFGDRDHTTMLHAVRKVQGRRDADAQFDSEIEEIVTVLRADRPAA